MTAQQARILAIMKSQQKRKEDVRNSVVTGKVTFKQDLI